MNKCGNNLKNENEAGEPWPFSLVFVFKIISTFIGQNPKFCYACVEEGCSASPTIAREKQTWNPFHLVENRISRDVITGKVYCHGR